MPIDLIATAFDLIAGQGLELAKDKAKRSERILKVLNAIGLKQDTPPANDFDGVYAYTLVIYGIDKPKPILEFFRHQFIKDAFRKSFEQRDESILEEETENFLDWNEIGKELIKLDYNPRREFAEFREHFITAAKLARTVQEIRVEHALEDISSDIQELPTKEDLRTEFFPLNQKLDLLLETNKGQDKREKIISFILPPRPQLIGRESEIAKINQLLQSGKQIIAITGVGGIGKTTLALEIAHQQILFEKIVIWGSAIDGGARNVDDIESSIWKTIVGGICKLRSQERREWVLKTLTDNKILVILDNLEDAEDLPAIFHLLSQFPNPSSALITTREHIPPTLGVSLELDRLPENDAVALFEHVVKG